MLFSICDSQAITSALVLNLPTHPVKFQTGQCQQLLCHANHPICNLPQVKGQMDVWRCQTAGTA